MRPADVYKNPTLFWADSQLQSRRAVLGLLPAKLLVQCLSVALIWRKLRHNRGPAFTKTNSGQPLCLATAA